ncbi:MAG: plastocyanin/azurin family copper-binding protein [Archangium sp.]
MKTLSLLLMLCSGVALADDLTVSQKDKTFAPGEVTVKAGQSVTFQNDDTVAHNVFSKEGKFNLKIQKPGEKKAVSFDEPGTYEVRCAIHPKMILKVKVTK